MEMENQDRPKVRKPQPWDNLRTRIELEIFAKQRGYKPGWVTNILNARAAERKG